MIDQAALFLLDMHYVNLYEQVVSADGHPTAQHQCKICREQVPAAAREKHHGDHKADRSQIRTEEIRARKEQNDMANKTDNKQTPLEQGIPAIYLREDGKAFLPGRDASLKRDLIASIDGLDNPNGLHKFDPTDAAKILAARGWNGFLVKSRNAREAKAAREARKAADKATATKAKVAAKRTAKKAPAQDASEVRPDPKPVKRERASRRG